MFRLWKNMDEEDKTRLVKITGFVMALFTIFTILSTVSYFFTWKVDQSTLAAPIRDASVEIRNACGKLGYQWGDVLVRRWFGLGSLAFIVILFAVTVRLLLKRWHYSMTKTILLTVSGALVASFILSFISYRFGWGNAFGGGLGGNLGETVVGWSRNLFGDILTALLLLLLLAIWLFFISSRFTRWFDSLFGSDESRKDAVGEDAATLAPFAKPKVREDTPKVQEDIPKVQEDIPKVQKVESSGGVERSETSEPPAPPRKPAVPAKEDKTVAEQPMEVIKADDLSTEVTEELPRIDVRDELPKYEFPPLSLLEEYATARNEVSDEELARNNNKIRATLENYRIQINDVKAIVGPTVTLYKVYPAPGVKIAEIKKLQEDIGMYLHARGVRVITLADSVGIEVANDKPSIVPMRAVLNDDAFRESKAELPIAIGYTIRESRSSTSPMPLISSWLVRPNRVSP